MIQFRRCIHFATALYFFLPAVAASAQNDELPTPIPQDFTCDSSYSTRVYVDGNQSDWENEVQPAQRVDQLVAGEYRYDWTGPNDASFMMWCRESENALYFAVVGRDNEIAGPQSGSQGDRFEIFLDVPQPNGHAQRLAFRVPVYPAAADTTTELLWITGGPEGTSVPAGRADVVSRQLGNAPGYFLEILVPRTALNTEFGVAPIPFAAVYRDIDGDARNEKEVGIATAPFNREEPAEMGLLHRGLVDVRLAAIRRSQGIQADVQPEHASFQNVGGGPQLEYIAILDNRLVVIGGDVGGYDQAAFPTEVVNDQETVDLQFRDLDLDGDMEIIHSFRLAREDLASGKTAEQRIAGLYDIDGQGINRFAHQEYAVSIEGVGELVSEIDFVSRPQLIIARFSRPARGDVDRSSWIDIDAEVDVDYAPMLLPWDERRQILYYPMGNEWQQRIE